MDQKLEVKAEAGDWKIEPVTIIWSSKEKLIIS